MGRLAGDARPRQPSRSGRRGDRAVSAERNRHLAQVELRAVAELRPHAQAGEVPQLSDADYSALKEDLEARGLQQPLEVTSAGTILDGHARHRALQQLGVQQVRVFLVEQADEVEYMVLAALRRRQL